MVSGYIRLASVFNVNTVDLELPKGSKCAIFKFFEGVVTKQIYISRREFLQIMKNVQELLSVRYQLYPNNVLQKNFQLDVNLRNDGTVFNFSGSTGNQVSQSEINPLTLIYLSNLTNKLLCRNKNGLKCGCN